MMKHRRITRVIASISLFPLLVGVESQAEDKTYSGNANLYFIADDDNSERDEDIVFGFNGNLAHDTFQEALRLRDNGRMMLSKGNRARGWRGGMTFTYDGIISSHYPLKLVADADNSSDSEDIIFGFDGTSIDSDIVEKMRLTDEGRLGLGTGDPQEKLDVDGAVRIGDTTNANAGTVRYHGGNFEGYDGSSWLDLGAGGDNLFDGRFTFSGGIQVGYSANTVPGSIRYHGGNFEGHDGSRWLDLGVGGDRYSGRMRLTKQGDGGGTTFSHNGLIRTDYGLKLVADADNNSDHEDIHFGFDGEGSADFAEKMRLTDEGNLILNHGGGKTTFSSDGLIRTDYGLKLVADADNTSDHEDILFGFDGEGSADFAEKMRLTDEGLLGLGTSDPQEKLDVHGAVRIGDTTNANAGTVRYHGGNFEGYDGSDWVSFTASPYERNPRETSSWTDPQTVVAEDVWLHRDLIVSLGDNGTTSPNGDNPPSVPDNGRIIFGETLVGELAGLTDHTNHPDNYIVNSKYAPADSAEHFPVPDAPVGHSNYNSDDGTTTGGMTMVTDGLPRFTVKNNGNTYIHKRLSIGLGAHVPGTSLTVGGAVHIGPDNLLPTEFDYDDQTEDYLLWVERGIVSEDFAIANVGNWSDHVFEDGYELMPLEAVEAHIEEVGHLPGVPSAAEVVKNGYTVHNMTRILLEKIEELTLHSIEQQKAIRQLEARLNEK